MPSMLNPGVGRTRILELTNEEWLVLFAGSLMTVAAVAAIRTDVTLWPAIGMGFTALVVGHLCLTARRFVAFPDLIAAAACLQWVVAPWLSDSYPAKMAIYHMTLKPSVYLQYAVPATIALRVGLHLPASRR